MTRTIYIIKFRTHTAEKGIALVVATCKSKAAQFFMEQLGKCDHELWVKNLGTDLNLERFCDAPSGFYSRVKMLSGVDINNIIGGNK